MYGGRRDEGAVRGAAVLCAYGGTKGPGGTEADVVEGIEERVARSRRVMLGLCTASGLDRIREAEVRLWAISRYADKCIFLRLSEAASRIRQFRVRVESLVF